MISNAHEWCDMDYFMLIISFQNLNIQMLSQCKWKANEVYSNTAAYILEFETMNGSIHHGSILFKKK